MTRKADKPQQQSTTAVTHEGICAHSCLHSIAVRLKLLERLALEEPDWLRADDDVFYGFLHILEDTSALAQLAMDKINVDP